MKQHEHANGALLPLGATKPVKLKSDATTWVMRDQNGQMARIKVVDMTDAHLFRWIRYFRKKYRDEGFHGSDAMLDATIRTSIVTAPAIFEEAKKRGLYTPPADTPTSSDPLAVWTEAVKRSRPQFYGAVLAQAESVTVGDGVVTVAFASVSLREQFDATRPLLARLANQAWRGPVELRSRLTSQPDGVAFPFKVQRPATAVNAAPGARKITLEDEE